LSKLIIEENRDVSELKENRDVSEFLGIGILRQNKNGS